MQITLRRNPKTVGWARRAAIALLVGFGVGAVAAPLTFFILLVHYNHATPKDPQNMLGALTLAVLVGAGLATLSAGASLGLAFLLRLGSKGNEAAPPAVVS